MEISVVIRVLVFLLVISLVVILITRRMQVPYTLGLVVVGFVLSVVISASGTDVNVRLTPELVLFVFLPPLLFEGSWSISLSALRNNWLTIFFLVLPGLLLQLVLIALPLYFLAHIDLANAFLLAAILSPTDPVAVLGLFRQLKVNENLSIIVEGESLFNDGVAGVLYQVFLAIVLTLVHGQQTSFGSILLQGFGVLLLQAGGGVLVGVLAGLLISRFVKYVNDRLVEITITIATAYGVYVLADALHMSGILAVIIAALIVGSYGVSHGMSEETRAAVDDFWGVVAFLANALLFLLVGVQLNPLALFSNAQPGPLIFTAGLVVVSVLIARYIMVLLLPLVLRGEASRRARSWRFVLFWSGLRGALSLALVLALPLDVPNRPALILSTYAVVFFTLLVQGFSIRSVLRRFPTTGASHT